jgi:hypothetical protein
MSPPRLALLYYLLFEAETFDDFSLYSMVSEVASRGKGHLVPKFK